MKTYGFGQGNHRGEWLLHLSYKTDLYISSIKYKHAKPSKCWMWESPDKCTYSQIYYILVSREILSRIYNTCPKMLMKFVYEKNTISYVGCMTQLFLVLFFIISECYMSTSIAYDHYSAICNPLLYKVTMSSQVYSMFPIGWLLSWVLQLFRNRNRCSSLMSSGSALPCATGGKWREASLPNPHYHNQRWRVGLDLPFLHSQSRFNCTLINRISSTVL